MKIVFIGLTISSSWGNGHATTYRALLCELVKLGHDVHFLEHEKPYYAKERDISSCHHFSLCFYNSIEELNSNYHQLVRTCDFLVIGSNVCQGADVIDWALSTAQNGCAFYDIDTPVTLAKLANEDYEYLRTDQIAAFDFYLSFSGGKALEVLQERHGAKEALPLYCSVNPEVYRPLDLPKEWLLGYLGTYSEDRQENLGMLLLKPAEKLESHSFAVAGTGFPAKDSWSENVNYIDHLPPDRHTWFYNSQVATVNVTRKAMRDLGYSPSIRLFEAAACGIPIISDQWEGLSDFFEIGKEIFVCNSTGELIQLLDSMNEQEFKAVGQAARQRVINQHTASHRAAQFMSYLGTFQN
jgi:spore maturation protein CgeB